MMICCFIGHDFSPYNVLGSVDDGGAQLKIINRMVRIKNYVEKGLNPENRSSCFFCRFSCLGAKYLIMSTVYK